MMSLPEHLQEKIHIEPNSGCWLWAGAISGSGYGRVKKPRSREAEQAHRAVYKILRGPIPEGLVLDHKCRTRCCVNPAHLRPLTNKENILCGTSPSARHAHKLVCDNGHSLADAYVVNGTRKCKTCQLANMKKLYQRRKLKRSETMQGVVLKLAEDR